MHFIKVKMDRHTRYQGLIIQNHQVLLIKHKRHSTGQAYWVIPGGGIDGPESEEQCVIREMKEETNLEVAVDRLVYDEPFPLEGGYKWLKTYLCTPLSGEASPGYEPEPEAAADYSISEVRWFNLQNESAWGEDLCQDPFTYPTLVRLRKTLGYKT